MSKQWPDGPTAPNHQAYQSGEGAIVQPAGPSDHEADRLFGDPSDLGDRHDPDNYDLFDDGDGQTDSDVHGPHWPFGGYENSTQGYDSGLDGEPETLLPSSRTLPEWPDDPWKILNQDPWQQWAIHYGPTPPPRDTTDYTQLAGKQAAVPKQTLGERFKSGVAVAKSIGQAAVKTLVTAPSQKLFAEVLSRVGNVPKEPLTPEDLEQKRRTTLKLGKLALGVGLLGLAGKAWLQYQTGTTIETNSAASAVQFNLSDNLNADQFNNNSTNPPEALEGTASHNLKEGIVGTGVGPDGATIPETAEIAQASDGIEGRGVGPDGAEHQSSVETSPEQQTTSQQPNNNPGNSEANTNPPAPEAQPPTEVPMPEKHVKVSSITLAEGENLWTKVSELLPPEATNTDIFEETARIMEANDLPVDRNSTSDPFAAARQLQIGQVLTVPPVL